MALDHSRPWDSDEIDTNWTAFRRILIDASKLVCGEKIKVEAKKKSWEDFGRKLEENTKEKQKVFYKVLKGMRKERPTSLKGIKGRNGDIICRDELIMERWREYFRDLLRDVELRDIQRDAEEVWVEDDYISEEELQEAINKVKIGKEAGLDEITPEMIKNMSSKGQVMCLRLLNLIWKEKRIPKDWKVAVIVLIYKGDNGKCGNHHGISLLSIPSKVYFRILGTRIRTVVDSQLGGEQYGFRAQRSTQDLIFIMRQITEKNVE